MTLTDNRTIAQWAMFWEVCPTKELTLECRNCRHQTDVTFSLERQEESSVTHLKAKALARLKCHVALRRTVLINAVG